MAKRKQKKKKPARNRSKKFGWGSGDIVIEQSKKKAMSKKVKQLLESAKHASGTRPAQD